MGTMNRALQSSRFVNKHERSASTPAQVPHDHLTGMIKTKSVVAVVEGSIGSNQHEAKLCPRTENNRTGWLKIDTSCAGSRVVDVVRCLFSHERVDGGAADCSNLMGIFRRNILCKR